jgi:hypothetical protein
MLVGGAMLSVVKPYMLSMTAKRAMLETRR